MKTSKSVQEGWMVVYNNQPYFPFFKTRREARSYNSWKTNKTGKVVRMKETTIYSWENK